MHFANAIAIVITGPFVLAMTDGVADAFEFVVTIILIGVDRGLRAGELFKRKDTALPLGCFS